MERLPSEINMSSFLNNNTFIRSTTMNTPRILLGLVALFAITLFVTATSFSQGNITLYGDATGTGILNVSGNLTNAKGADLLVNNDVRMRGNTAGTQTIANSSGTWTITFGTYLRFGRARNKAIGTTTNAIVNTELDFGYAANTMSGNFTLGSNTLTVAAVSTYFAGSTGIPTLSGGTVNHTQIGGSQTLLNYGAAYGALGLSGTATKILPAIGSAVSASGAVTHAGGAVTFNESFNITATGSGSFATITDIATGKIVDFQSTASTGSIATVSNVTGTLRKSGTQDLGITTVTANPGIIENTGTAGTLTIGTLTANAGTIRNTNTGLVAFTNAAASNGTITASNGTVTFVNNLGGTGTVSLTGGTMQFGGTLAQSIYTLTAGTTVYNSSTAGQNIVGTTYNNLTLNNASKTLAGPTIITGNLTNDASSTLAMGGNNITLSGNLTIASDITNGAGVLTMNSASSNVTGAGLVQGSVRRAHNFALNTPYKFNGQNIYLATTGRC